MGPGCKNRLSGRSGRARPPRSSPAPTEGELGILPGHTPLLGALEPGWVVRIDRAEESELRVAVHGGFLSVRKDGVSVLAEMAEAAEDIDTARARAALDRADPESGPEGEAARDRALSRLRAAGESV